MRILNLTSVRHAVVVAPHSDDETIGVFHLIRKLRAQGSRVDVVVVTDGSASHRNSATFPKTRLIAERQAETLNAMRFAGVTKGHVEFLGLPDGGLDTYPQPARCKAIEMLARRPAPDLVVEPTCDDDHPDHRNVAQMCARAWPPRIRRLRYMVWPANASGTNSRPLLSVTGNIGAKRLALGRYRTQLGLISDDPHGFALSDAMIHRMCRAQEHFKWG